jgi:hypothetical protein
MPCQSIGRDPCVGKGYSTMKQHLALYGNTGIPRGYCYKCSRHALIVGGLLQCCDRPVETAPTKLRRMSDPEGRRRTPKLNERNEILQSQNYRCLYCDVSLDGYVFYRGQERRVRTTWDHMVPYSHTFNNHAGNFAATCQFCNAWKSSLIFKSVDEVRIYVAQKWETEREAESRLRGMREEVRTETPLAEVLHADVSVSSLEPSASASD